MAELVAYKHLVERHHLYRLWSIPLLTIGVWNLIRAMESGKLALGLFGIGMMLAGVFAFRHDLMDISPSGLDPRQLGYVWSALLMLGFLLMVSSVLVTFAPGA